MCACKQRNFCHRRERLQTTKFRQQEMSANCCGTTRLPVPSSIKVTNAGCVARVSTPEKAVVTLLALRDLAAARWPSPLLVLAARTRAPRERPRARLMASVGISPVASGRVRAHTLNNIFIIKYRNLPRYRGCRRGVISDAARACVRFDAAEDVRSNRLMH